MSTHPNRSKVSDWPGYLREFRNRFGLTQAQLAKQLSVTEDDVSAWERGRYRPRAYLKLALKEINRQLQFMPTATAKPREDL